MKKSTLMALLLAALPTALWAQDCPAVTAPYLLDFETATVPAIPNCTTQSVGFGPQWATVDNPGHGFEDITLQCGPSVEASESWFYTQGITLTPGTYRLSYRYGNDSSTTTEKLRTAFVTDPSAPVNSYIATHDAITGGQPVEYSFENPVTVSETRTFYFGFNAFSDPNQGTLYVDNISVQPLVCSPPTAISVTNITPTSATVSWMPSTGPITIGYFYGVSTTNTPPTNFQMTPNLMRDIADLQPNTTYYAFVSTLCGNPVSEWISMEFTTPCAAATVPYTLDFESDTTVPEIPACTTVTEFDRGMNWRTDAAPGHGFDSNVLYYPDSDEPAEAWFFTQGIELQAGMVYRFSYKYGNDSTETTERLRTLMTTSPTRPDNDPERQYLTDHPEITGGTAVEFSYENPIAISTTGVYYFGFNAYSASEQGSLYVDNIQVQEWMCGVPQEVTVDDITTTTATLNWEEQTEPTTIGYFFGYSTTDTPPANFIMVTGQTGGFTGLEPNTTYYAYVRTMCGNIFSDWVSVPFTTTATAGLNDAVFAGFKAYPNPVNNVLTLQNAIAIEKVEAYNITGQLVLTQNIESTNAQIDVQTLPVGAYMLNVYSGNARKSMKFIKQ
ncbi:T9SS type A sorting domain-containing protein [Flavobacterium sp. Sd200]|uniref:fibronectin type III domain-containing protein n=1 Tax=Flavobacterium sp. Sd200 TaxID=2692211 RepID=UPI00136A5D89|nr:fibronectin type III domain-containing protein [Flavobacterium sp. Sd200]MXN92019.1 T9SS type A sorting domain-containing protein [Flavobacterium sp. Sd200]